MFCVKSLGVPDKHELLMHSVRQTVLHIIGRQKRMSSKSADRQTVLHATPQPPVNGHFVESKVNKRVQLLMLLNKKSGNISGCPNH